ncbi:ParB/RepB/Spo0J family partition protein [Marinobacter halodurans]|nr:ParB/RepB/Spo0J family partition protein [Marinobacter halodurans]
MSEKKHGKGLFNPSAPAMSDEGKKRTFAKPANSKSARSAAVTEPVPEVTDEYIEIPSKLVRNWRFKDRTAVELEDDPEYSALVDEIREQGVISPITVRPIEGASADGFQYEEVVGFKRLSACKALGIDVPAHVRELSDLEAARLQKSENTGRSAPSAWSLGQHYKTLLEQGMAETQTQLAASLGIDRVTLTNLLRIANNIPDDISKSIKLHRLGSTALLKMVSLLGEKAGRSSEAMVDRIVEFADEFNEKPEKSSTILAKIEASFDSSTQKSLSGSTFRSQKGKALSVKPGKDKLSVTMHAAALSVASPEEITEALTKFLEAKGLTLEEAKNSK